MLTKPYNKRLLINPKWSKPINPFKYSGLIFSLYYPHGEIFLHTDSINLFFFVHSVKQFINQHPKKC